MRINGRALRRGLCLFTITVAMLIFSRWAYAAGELIDQLKADPYLFREVVDQAGGAAIKTLTAGMEETKLGAASSLKKAAEKEDMSSDEFLRKFKESLFDEPDDSERELENKRQARAKWIEQLASGSAKVSIADAYAAAVSKLKSDCGSKRPRIHNIGAQSILTFESAKSVRPSVAGERSVRIPIDGYDLDPRCVSLGVQLGGTMQVTRKGQTEKAPDLKDFHVQLPTADQPDIANIVLLQPYIDRLKTGDKLSVSVSVSNRYASDGAEAGRRVTFPKRIFTLYEVEDYRKQFQSSRILPHDFAAFPLPEKEAEALFGPLVSKYYFVVRLSIRNTDVEAKLVSTGMIRATGSALILPKGAKDKKERVYTLPVTVVPHSLQQIYKLVQDEEVTQSRPTFFRGLELVGALAAGWQALAADVTLQASRNIGFLTGVVIPEGKKAWPDRWPGYQANLVNFSMPDLLKVASNSVADHKFLFFSKQEIDGLVSDPNLFSTAADSMDTQRGGSNLRDEFKPDAFVISLEFDNLDIRFEKVFQVATITSRDQLLDASSEATRLVAIMADGKDWYGSVPKAQLGMDKAEFDRIAKLIQDVKNDGNKSLLDPAKLPELTKAISQLDKLTGTLKHGSNPTSSHYIDWYGTGKYNIDAVAAQADRVKRLIQRLNAGADADAMKDQMDEVLKVVNGGKTVVRFYQELANTYQNSEPHLNTIKNELPNMADANKKADAEQKISNAVAAINRGADDLAKVKPAEGVSY